MAGRAGHHGGPDRPCPGADHPRWPASDASGWQQAASDPSWPYPGADHPSWPAGAAGADWPQPGTDYPSWPATAEQPGWFEGADHPSWPASDASGWQQAASDPSRPAGAAGGDWPQPGTDYPSWPANGPGSSWVPKGGEGAWQQQAPVVQHHDERWQAPAPVPPRAPAPVTRWEYPARAAGAHAKKTQQWSAQLARTQDPVTQTYYELAFGDGRLQVMLTEPPAADRGPATGMHAVPVGVLQRDGEQARPGMWQAEDLRNADSARVAERVLSDADYRAAEIRREAGAHATAIREAAEQEAAEIRQQAAAQATPVREAAEREAAEMREQAAAQATAIREAAQREAEALRSDVLRMSADLDQMAAYITEKFTGPIERVTGDISPAAGGARPADPFAAPPGASTRTVEGYPEPADAYGAPAPAAAPHETPPPEEGADPRGKAAPGARATSRAAPATTPRTPRTRPGPATLPTRKEEHPAKSRQYRTMRVFAGTIAALVVVAVGTGAYQLATRGYTFFIFRSAGTGATDNNAVFPGSRHPPPKPSAAHHQPVKGRHARGAQHHRHHRGTQHH